MIVVQEGVWRSDCIACIDTDLECQIQIYRVNIEEPLCYDYENRELMLAEYMKAVATWKKELEEKNR